jgi:hypothetical protein
MSTSQPSSARPLHHLPARPPGPTMRMIAGGVVETDVPDRNRRDEVGGMAQAVQVFRDHMVQARDLAAEQERICTEAAAERQAAAHRLVDQFETELGALAQELAGRSAPCRTPPASWPIPRRRPARRPAPSLPPQSRPAPGCRPWPPRRRRSPPRSARSAGGWRSRPARPPRPSPMRRTRTAPSRPSPPGPSGSAGSSASLATSPGRPTCWR